MTKSATNHDNQQASNNNSNSSSRSNNGNSNNSDNNNSQICQQQIRQIALKMLWHSNVSVDGQFQLDRGSEGWPRGAGGGESERVVLSSN